MCVCVYPKAYEHELLSEEFEFFPIISICEHCVCVCAYPTTTLVLVVIDTNKTHFANLVARHYVATHCVCFWSIGSIGSRWFEVIDWVGCVCVLVQVIGRVVG